MYFCYIDESGDSGLYDPLNPGKSGSSFFILAGLIVHSTKWKISLDMIKSFRKKIAREAYLQYDVEFHCAELIDPHKIRAYTQISVSDRWKLIEEYAETLGQHTAFNMLSVVIDKGISALEPEDYLTASITKFYQAYDEFLRAQKENGIVLFDRANEKAITTHVRKLLGTGSGSHTIPNVRIGWVIEDPIFRISNDSMFIQSSDVIAYTLKEKEFPQGSRKKFHANEIFSKKLHSICLKGNLYDEDGISRI